MDELRERVQREDHRGGAREEEEEEDVKPPLGLRRHAEDSRPGAMAPRARDVAIPSDALGLQWLLPVLGCVRESK